MQDMIHEECGVFGIYDKNMVIRYLLWFICLTTSWTRKLWYCGQ